MIRTSLLLYLGPYIFLALATLVGAYLIFLGLRGRRHFSEPRCRKCKADLRDSIIASGSEQPAACPQCGSALSRNRAYYFARSGRRPGILFTGIIALAGLYYLMTPFLIWGQSGWVNVRSYQTSFYAPSIPMPPMAPAAMPPATSAGPMGNQPPTYLPPSGMPPGAMPPGIMPPSAMPPGMMGPSTMPPGMRPLNVVPPTELSHEDIERHLSEVLDAWQQDKENQSRTQSTPRRRLQSRHWLSTWDTGWISRLDESQLRRLAVAYFGTEPDIALPDKIPVGQGFTCRVSYESYRGMPSMKFAYSLREIKAGEQSLTIQSKNAPLPDPDYLSATQFDIACSVSGNLPVGTHELTFVIDAGLFANGQPMAGIDGNPGQMKHWRNPKTTWTMTVTKTIEVVPADYVTPTTAP